MARNPNPIPFDTGVIVNIKILISAAFAATVVGASTAAFSPALQAQDAWPSKPIRFIIPSGAGGASDFVGRTFGRYVEGHLKQPVVVENRPGAGAIIGSELIKNAAPDGYTYLVGGSSVSAANPYLYTKLPYDPVKDFDEVGLFGFFPIIGMVKKDSPIKSVSDIIRMAKANPGKVSFAYYSALAQISPEIIKTRAGVDLLGVSYKNVGQVSTDVAGGVIDFTFLDAIGAAPVLQSGLLRPIAVTSPQRVASMPDGGRNPARVRGAGLAGVDGAQGRPGCRAGAHERTDPRSSG
jgi:tripartite-type tricarboxylate transporter receptor subunit TctC